MITDPFFTDPFFTDPEVHFPRKVQLLPDVLVYEMPAGLGFQFRGSLHPTIIQGEGAGFFFSKVVPLLDGSRSLEELVEATQDLFPVAALSSGLKLLHQHGLLAREPHSFRDLSGGRDDGLKRQMLYWGRKINLTARNSQPAAIHELLANEPILLMGSGMFLAATLDVLHRTGFGQVHCVQIGEDAALSETLDQASDAYVSRMSFPTPEAALHTSLLQRAPKMAIVAGRKLSTPFRNQLNAFFMEYGIPFLSANEDGMEYELGPFVIPGQSACLQCLDIRKSARSKFQEAEDQLHGAQVLAPGDHGPLLGEDLAANGIAAGILAMEATRILTGNALPTLLNQVLYFTPITGQLDYQPLLRVGHCPACSS